MTKVKDYSRGVRVLRIICDIVFVLGLFLSWVFSLNLMRELWYVFGLAGLGSVLFHTGPESDAALGIVQCVYAVGRFFCWIARGVKKSVCFLADLAADTDVFNVALVGTFLFVFTVLLVITVLAEV